VISAPGSDEQARARGIIPAVRINPLQDEGLADLRAVIAGRPQLVLLPKAASGWQMSALAEELDRLEAAHGIEPGTIEIVPTIETALGVVNLSAIAAGSRRVRSALLGTEDLAADLMAERGRDAEELAYARPRFLLECRALGIEPIDHPYTYADAEGRAAESARARRLGYRSKSAVGADHIAAIHRILTRRLKKSLPPPASSRRLRQPARPVLIGRWSMVSGSSRQPVSTPAGCSSGPAVSVS
jgi:citrate lyase subunit beta/citryl-CoA lyase